MHLANVPKCKVLKKPSKAEMVYSRKLYPLREHPSLMHGGPKTRGECHPMRGVDENGDLNPCPWVSCKYHLAFEINPLNGSIKANFPDLEPGELPHSCALDAADISGLTLEEVAVLTNLTKERVRQIQDAALVHFHHLGDEPVVKHETRKPIHVREKSVGDEFALMRRRHAK